MIRVGDTTPGANQAPERIEACAETHFAGESLVDHIGRHGLGRSAEWWFPHQDLRMTVADLDGRAFAYAHRLAELGIRRGDRIGLALSNVLFYVALLVALWRLNAVPVPLRPYRGRGKGYGPYLQGAEAACDFHGIIHDADIPDSVFADWSLRTGKPVIAADHLAQLPQRIAVPALSLTQPDDIALLQLTSGTMGDPKAVIVTHAMMMRQLRYLSDCHVYYTGHNVRSAASWLPIHHDMGLFTGVLLPLFDGSHNLLAPPLFYMRNPRRWFELLSEVRADLNFATNTSVLVACDALSRRGDGPRIDLSSLQLYFGAEKVTGAVLRRAAAVLGPLNLTPERMHVGYGMAENALAATRTPRCGVREETVAIDRDGPIKLVTPDSVGAQTVVSVGRPLAGYDISIRDRHGQRLAELSLGEIHVAGPCVTPGYFRNPEATRRFFSDRALRTGDWGFIHDGELFFVGRKDDLLNIGGRKLVPDDVEHTAEALEFVGPGRACLLAIEDARRGTQIPLLLIESPKNVSPKTVTEWMARIRDAILDQHDLLMTRILFCAKGVIEKTSSGKKRRKLIKLRYLAGEIGLTHDHGYVFAL